MTLFAAMALATVATAAPVAPTAPKPRVLVLAPETTSVDAAAVASLTGVITAELAKDSRLDVIGAADVNDLAGLEAEKQAAGCDSAGCFAEIADALGARYVIFGDVNSLGNSTVLNLRVFDTETSNALRRLSLQADTVAQLADRVRGEARGIGDAIAAPGTSTLAMPSVTLPTSPRFTGFALIGGGVVVGAGAVLADLFLPSSRNETLDGVDAVWPVLYIGVAPAAVIVGTVIALTSGEGGP